MPETVTAGPMSDRMARDVMSARPITVEPEESLLSAWELFDRGGFRHLPVVGPDGRCLSLIDDRLVALSLGTRTALARPLVRDVMPPRVHCVLPEASIERIAQIMCVEGATAVPVVNDRHQLVGIVTDRDLIALLAGVM